MVLLVICLVMGASMQSVKKMTGVYSIYHLSVPYIYLEPLYSRGFCICTVLVTVMSTDSNEIMNTNRYFSEILISVGFDVVAKKGKGQLNAVLDCINLSIISKPWEIIVPHCSVLIRSHLNISSGHHTLRSIL